MTKAVARALQDKAIAAGMVATVEGTPAGPDPAANPEEYTVRVTKPGGGSLGPEVLKVISDAGVSLASSDVLLK